MKKVLTDHLSINNSKKINVLFCFPKQSFSHSKYKEVKENVALFKNSTLIKQFRYYIMSNTLLQEYRNASFYLNKGNKYIKLDKDKTISQLRLKNGDIIIISYYEPKIIQQETHNSERNELKDEENISEPEIYIKNQNLEQKVITTEKIEHLPTNDNLSLKKNIPKKKKWIKYLIIGLLILLALVIFIIVYFLLKKNPQTPLVFQKEKLIVNKSYPENRLFMFNSKQVNEMIIEGEKINRENSYHNFNKTSDFIFITRNAYIEKDENNLIEKEWYSGYIGIFHLIVPNTTHNNHIIYDKTINGVLNITRNESNEKDIFYESNETNYCFIKLEFYKNGEIKNIYLPKGFLLGYYSYIEEIVKLLIPKISEHLYIESIDDKLNEIIEQDNNEKNDSYFKEDEEDKEDKEHEISKEGETGEEGEEEEGEEDEEEGNNNYLRILKMKKREKYLNYKNSIRKLSDEDNNELNNSEISYTLENYLTPPLTEFIEYDLREAKLINDSLYDITTDIMIDNNGINMSNYTNLTECTIKSIETDEVKLEGGLVNTTIYSLIDEQGFLKSVYEISTTLMKPPDESEEENDEETDYLYSQIYNQDNQITLEQAKEADKEGFQKNNFSFGIDSFFSNSSNIINCTAHFIDENVNKKLYGYFDSFEYILYTNETNNSDYSIKDDEYDNNYRSLSENENVENSYYGMKKITYMKQLYKYNLIGMKMESQIYSEINPATGRLDVYTIMNFGNKNSKIKVKEQISNNHIILERANQMGYKLIQLLNQTNNELIERNQNYSEIIIEFENNFTNYFEEYYDYSNLFRSSLNDMYNQIQNFSGLFFYELIDLINRVYDNYTIILDDVKKGEYDFINRIRIVTKEEYINYIYSMIQLLENFENKTLKFLDDIDNELNNIEDFQIDILYDIKEQIYESKQIFKTFNRNLFKSIEKGILTFKCDINDYIDLIIGDLLYITDFLAVNINKNELIIKAIDENTRKEVSVKLKNFRNIILTIIELLIQNINNDFDKEMNINDNTSIKYISNEKALEFLSNIEKNSNDVINKIKARIDHINIYESFSENIDVINDINNKTLIEFINDMYISTIYKTLNIKPEYTKENSSINHNKNLLFNISVNITNTINKDIKEINDYIFSYTKQYVEKYIYNIHYDLYYFRKSFLNDEMENLLNEFYLLLNRTIKINLKELIDYNFGLANQVFDEENAYFTKYRGKKRRFLNSGFIERYYKYKAKFEEFVILTYSDNFLNLLEKYFYKLRDDILNHIKNKIFSVNKFYFNHEYYTKIFYFNEQANNEILKIIDNINNYYNELTIDGDIKLKALNLSQEILKPYHTKLINDLDKYYNKLYGRTTHYHVKDKKKDFAYSYWRSLKGWKNIYLYTKHYKNINKVLTDLKKTDEYLLKETNIIFNNFISKFDNYLNNYTSICQNLYSSLNQYIENKLNNNPEKMLIENYNDIFNEMILNDSNKGLLKTINYQINNIKENIDIYLNKLSNNIKLLNEKYYNLFYLPNYDNFLEYPEEINYKINQFYNETIYNLDNIKSVVNFIYNKKIKYIIKSTNLYINNFIKNYIDYIKVNINSSFIFDKFYLTKYKELDALYNICISNNTIDELNNNEASNLDDESLNNKISLNLDYINDFIFSLEKQINETFINIICENDTKTNENETICYEIKKEFDAMYSKYNYNIVKLRTGIYYTKTLLENIDSLFDEYDFHNIIDSKKIEFYDELINNKNILDIYNKTNYKLININKDSEILINETYQYFIEDFKNKYSLKKDYLPFAKSFEEIIKFESNSYNKNINNTVKIITDNIISLMNEFNQTLLEQLSLRDNYIYNNFNQTYFKNMFISYKSSIKNIFNLTEENITYLTNVNNDIFHNGIKKILSKLQINKRTYIKNIINDFSKNYDYNLLNISYNLGERIEYFLEKEYDDYEFSFIYDYVETFENYTKSYINKLIEIIDSIENELFPYFENIYNNFLNELESNASSFLTLDYIEILHNNQTKCSIYINYTNDNLTDDQQYINIINNINSFFSNCSNINDNLTLSEQILYIFKNWNYCSNFLIEFINISYYNETLEMMDCFINNYYIYNYTFIYFNSFNDTYKENLDNIINKIDAMFKKNRFDENYLNDFLEKQNYQLENYEGIDLSDISYDFEDFEIIINYVNYLKNDEYKNFLYDLFISSFNSSYSNFINNFILDELIDDVTVSINNKLEIHLDYMIKKIKDEYSYYLLILETTDELGYSSKLALINLYEDIKVKLNETIFYLLEDDIYFYLNLFYRENKKMFRNNFINYCLSNNNEYNINIYKIEKFSDEIILDQKFNKTIDEISKYLINDTIIGIIKEKIIESIYNKTQELYNIVEAYKVNIEEILNKKGTRPLPQDMTHINEIIINYTNLVNNQKNRYLLNISEKPFEILYEFIHGKLEPPLTLIKDQYNTIEQRLLKELFDIIDNFPNYYLIIKDILGLEKMIENITPYITHANETIFTYLEVLDKDIISYINKLIHYTYIYGLYYQDSPCEESFCFNESELFDTIGENNDNRRRLHKVIERYDLLQFSKLDKEKINKYKNRRLENSEEYNSSMGAITENDINSFILDMQTIICEFNKSYLSNEFKNINRIANIYLEKINNTFLFKLRRSIEMISIKFKSIFTEDNFKIFENKLFSQYDNISIYINEQSDLIDKIRNKFVNTLNDSSILIDMMFNVMHFKINSYYKIFYQLIQDKLKYINSNDYDSLYNLKRILEEKKKEDVEDSKISKTKEIKINKNGKSEKVELTTKIKNFFKDMFKEAGQGSLLDIKKGEKISLKIKEQLLSNYNNEEKSLFDKEGNFKKEKIESVFKEFELDINIGGSCNLDKCNLMAGFCFNLFNIKFDDVFVFPIKLLPYLECAISIIPFVKSDICIELGPVLYTKKEDKDKNSFDIDISGGASVGVTLDFGVYFPSLTSPIRLSFNVGLMGILGSGKVGVELSLYFKDKFGVDLYFKFKAFELSFYVMFTLTFKISCPPVTINFSFSFYIFQKVFGGLYYEYHNIREYKYSRAKINHISNINKKLKW